MTLHVHHEFHAVGHGTFFVGNMLLEGSGVPGEYETYNWVFDCGSRRPSQIEKAISAVEKSQIWKNEIDMIVVSHFDNDHINGLEQLLENNSVKTLVLPYASYRQRLACMASAHPSMEAVSPEVAIFGLDPVGYLSSRGLLTKIRRIVFVIGGNSGALDGGGALDPDVVPQQGADATQWSQLWGDSEYERVESGNISGCTTFGKLPQNAPVVLGNFHWEFLFYNAALPDEKATRSGADIKDVQSEVANILRRNRVLEGKGQPKRGWRTDLRNCYIKHFGNSGPERNNISLCVLARPIGGYSTESCSIFCGEIERSGVVQELPIFDTPQALLLTGDLEIDESQMIAMRTHFRDWRWRELNVMQIPHHGSSHSWKRGNSALSGQRNSVLCVPTERGCGHHPHQTVLEDLVGHGPVHADYHQSVVHTFHLTRTLR